MLKKFGKKSLTIFLTMVMVFSIAGCAKTTTTKDATDKPKVEEPKKENTVLADAVNNYFANMPTDVYKIGEKEFLDKVKAGDPSIFIMDIRTKEDYDKGHVKGAVSIPWGTAIGDKLEMLPSDKTIYIYCYTGQTAGQTVALINMAGYTAKSVNLGWNLGISKVEGVAVLTETTATELKAGTNTVKPEIKDAITKYYKGLADVNSTIYKFYKIGEDDLKKFVDAKDKSIYILSVRKAEDYLAGHIEGALNIPFGAGMEKKFNTLPKDKKIVVYCYTGQTAGQVVAGLRMLGYDAVSLNAGMGTKANAPAGWANKGFPVVK